MAKKGIPSPIERRHLLERELDAAHCMRLAEAYLEVDRPVEAVAFLAKAEAVEQLEGLAERAIERGDVFLFRQACSASGRVPEPEEWRRLASAAEQAGKLRYVAMARRQADGGED